jgi:hypothetical protein
MGFRVADGPQNQKPTECLYNEGWSAVRVNLICDQKTSNHAPLALAKPFGTRRFLPVHVDTSKVLHLQHLNEPCDDVKNVGDCSTRTSTS